jgi:hypothetical protein
MGFGKSSGSSAPVVTQEQKDLLAAQTGFLTNTAFPAYAQTIGGAKDVLGNVMPAATNAANNASAVAQQTGGLQQAAGTAAYGSGLAGQGQLAGFQGSLGQQLSGGGAAGLGNMAGYQQGLGAGLTGAGASGVGNTAAYQTALGQNLTGTGASNLSQLFSPQYAQQQVNAALQPAMEQVRDAMSGQNASYGAAGGLGSSRAALAQANLQSLSNQRLGTVAAQTQQGIEANRAAASQALLNAGQTATGQAGNLYQGLLGSGMGASNQAQNAYGQLLNAGQGANAQAAGLYGNLAGQGAAGLNAANQAAAARIGYAGTPQDVYSKYASVIYGTPQGSTTPNFAGTQGQTTSGKSGHIGG